MHKAIIFDMDGTMIDNMAYHLLAWERMAAELGSSLRGDALMAQLYGSNRGVVERVFGPNRFSDAEIIQIGDTKEAYYRELYHPHIQLIDGLSEFLAINQSMGIPMGLGTASNMPNIDLTLDALDIRRYFSTIVSADDVSNGKPDPETYLKAAGQLGCNPQDCLVFEDVPKGVQAAARAGMKAIVLTTTHQQQDFDQFDNIIRFVANYEELIIDNG